MKIILIKKKILIPKTPANESPIEWMGGPLSINNKIANRYKMKQLLSNYMF